MIKHSFDELLNILKSRIAQIELNRELYTISEKYDERDMSGTINIKYDGIGWVSLFYLCSKVYINGKNTLRTSFSIKACIYPGWYEECKPDLFHTIVHIDESLRPIIYNVIYTMEQCFDKYLPIGNENEKEIIKNSLTNIGLRDVEVVFDTFRKHISLNQTFMKS